MEIKKQFSLLYLASRPATAGSSHSASASRPTTSDATSRPAREGASGTTVR